MSCLTAHIKKNEENEWRIHSLEEHLKGVAQLASQSADKFSNSDWLEAAGLLHDIGKSSPEWQAYIADRTGYQDQPDGEAGPGNVPHSTHGASWAYEEWPPVGKVLAYLIAGHHGGLPDWYHEIGVGGGLEHRLKKEEIDKLPRISDGIRELTENQCTSPYSQPCGTRLEDEQIHLWIRMLYSTLVDADFLDTENFMSPERKSQRGGYRNLGELKTCFDAHMSELVNKALESQVNKIRNRILEQCRSAAHESSGLFSLTVPTGGGKTLSSMAFALDHAIEHHKDRIIMVIPYTSIIEQTAKVYRSIFGEDNVLEHHSSLDPDEETLKSRLASENWDAPIIVTTSVRFFESLFAAKPSACRKLHNIVNSVVILDEVQMLPTNYLKPILFGMKGLLTLFKVSMVFCTATQPAITDRIFRKGNGEHYSILEDIPCREMIRNPPPDELTRSLQRVEIKPIEEPLEDWESLAERLTSHESVLCIVNTRRNCQELHERMPEGSWHLSANMCGEHRSRVIERIKRKLEDGEPVRVISTQLVEAGVDLDFPVVYRAMAGFDSIAQAAGRCNREGLLPGKGQVFVFRPPEQAPIGSLRKGAQAGEEILSVDPEGCRNLNPETFRRYFNQYFMSLNSFDTRNIMDSLASDANPNLNFQFRTAAKNFRMIDDAKQQSVVVWYQGEKTNSIDLIEQLRKDGPSKNLMRRLQRFTVTIPERVFREVQDSFEEPEPVKGIWCQCADSVYDDIRGFTDNTSSVY